MNHLCTLWSWLSQSEVMQCLQDVWWWFSIVFESKTGSWTDTATVVWWQAGWDYFGIMSEISWPLPHHTAQCAYFYDSKELKSWKTFRLFIHVYICSMYINVSRTTSSINFSDVQRSHVGNGHSPVCLKISRHYMTNKFRDIRNAAWQLDRWPFTYFWDHVHCAALNAAVCEESHVHNRWIMALQLHVLETAIRLLFQWRETTRGNSNWCRQCL